MFSKCRFFVIKIKRNLFAILFLVFACSLLLFSKHNLPAVKAGLSLWAGSVLPSLFPFFVATELLMHTSMVAFLGRILNPLMKPLFRIRGEGAFAFLMGMMSGYPVGAKIACRFREDNVCSKVECERLLSFTNNSGPLFIVGTVGISMFGSTQIGLLLLATHILACITVGIIFRFWKGSPSDTLSSPIKKEKRRPIEMVHFSNLGSVLAESITSGISTILMIGGFVVIFSSILSILKASGILGTFEVILSPLFQFIHLDNHFITPILTGFLEITNGISLLSGIKIKAISVSIILAAFFLGFGGLSIFLQVWSITSKTDLSIKPYFYGKLIHGLLAACYTFLVMQIFPFLNFDL